MNGESDPAGDSHTPRLDVETLTWAALLTQCMALAQAAVALPDGADDPSGEAAAWRASVPHVIQLQAVWFALQRSGELTADEQRLGRDRAAVSLENHVGRLEAIWTPHGGLPGSVVSLVEDVRQVVSG